MNVYARWLGAVLTGLGAAGGAAADPSPKPVPPARGWELGAASGVKTPAANAGPRPAVLPSYGAVTRPAAAAQAAPEWTMTAGTPVASPEPTPVPVPPPPPPLAPPPMLDPAACAPVACPCPGPMFWCEADVLWWWYRGSSLPALVTTGAAGDPVPGAFGQPGTALLFGGTMDDDCSPGVRVRMGGFLGASSPFGWEIGGFYTEPQLEAASFDGSTVPVLARPFFDAFQLTPGSFLFAAPGGGFTGAVDARNRTTFWGAEVNGLAALDTGGSNVGFVGYRYLQMTDDLRVAGRFAVGPNGLAFVNGVSLAPGATGTIEDRVNVKNEFHGAQVGWRYRGESGPVGVEVRASVAVGLGTQEVEIAGNTNTVDADGTVRNAPTGLLAQGSNSGRWDRDRLTVVPEVGLRGFVRVAQGVYVHGGYDALYWASVARAGQQLDAAVDPRASPTSGLFTGARVGARPVVLQRDTNFWAHGFHVGVRFEY